VCEFDLLYGLGISKESSLLDLAVERELVQKSGAWFSYKDARIAQGRENARKFLVDNPDIAREIEQALRASMNMGPVHSEGEDEGNTGSED
jgi:recombination protein RecA